MPLPVWDHRQGHELRHTLTFLTDVLPAATAFEQRRKLRPFGPRHRIQSTFVVSARRRQQMEMKLARHAGGEWELPLPMFGQALGALLASGSSSIPADTVDRGFVAGGRALLGDPDSDVRELVTISAVAADTLTLSAPTTTAWPLGTMLYPLRRARLTAAPELPRFTGLDTYGEVEFELTEPLDWRTFTWPVTYRGAPVMTLAVDWSQDPLVTLPRTLATVDVQTGVQAVYDLPDVPLGGLQVVYTAVDRAAIADLYALLYALAGRLASVWVTSLARDFEPVASAGSGATSLDVEAFGLDDADLPTTRRDIRIQFANGSVVYRRITNVTTPSAGVERITLDSALGTAITPGDGTVISWLWLARQSADVNALGYWTGDCIETSLQFEGVNHDL
jgi:hypothetical protein